MMVECYLWILIIQTTVETKFYMNILKAYVLILFIVNAIAQLVCLIVFAVYASEAVGQNRKKIIAYNQGLYFIKYGSIQEEIIQTSSSLKAAQRISNFSFIFIFFILFLFSIIFIFYYLILNLFF